jgi:hypothetical protein
LLLFGEALKEQKKPKRVKVRRASEAAEGDVIDEDTYERERTKHATSLRRVSEEVEEEGGGGENAGKERPKKRVKTVVTTTITRAEDEEEDDD